MRSMEREGHDELDIEDYMASVGVDMLHPGGMRRTEELAEMCSIAKGCKVLDVGCGYGRTARFLASKIGCHVTGVDISERMVDGGWSKVKKEGLEDRVELRLMSAESLAFPEDSFDVVISEGALTLVDKQVVIREMIRVCRRGGRIGLNELSWMKDPPRELVEKAQKELQGVSPLTYDGWTQLLVTSGLKKAQSHRYRYKSTSFEVLGSIGAVGLLKVTKRYLLDSRMRHWVNKQERIFRDYSDYWGYGLYEGVKI